MVFRGEVIFERHEQVEPFAVFGSRVQSRRELVAVACSHCGVRQFVRDTDAAIGRLPCRCVDCGGPLVREFAGAKQ